MRNLSHASQQQVGDDMSGYDFIVEMAPFESDACDDPGHYKIFSAPQGCNLNLPSHAICHLNDLRRYFF